MKIIAIILGLLLVFWSGLNHGRAYQKLQDRAALVTAAAPPRGTWDMLLDKMIFELGASNVLFITQQNGQAVAIRVNSSTNVAIMDAEVVMREYAPRRP